MQAPHHSIRLPSLVPRPSAVPRVVAIRLAVDYNLQIGGEGVGQGERVVSRPARWRLDLLFYICICCTCCVSLAQACTSPYTQ